MGESTRIGLVVVYGIVLVVLVAFGVFKLWDDRQKRRRAQEKLK